MKEEGIHDKGLYRYFHTGVPSKCTGCHDPHPSNTNYGYLKVGTEGEKKMGVFCARCNGNRVDKSEL